MRMIKLGVKVLLKEKHRRKLIEIEPWEKALLENTGVKC